MSFDHLWMGFFVDETEYEKIRPDFESAAEKMSLSPEAQQALDEWRRRPSAFDQVETMRDEADARADAFIWAFNLSGFDQLALEFLTLNGKFVEFAERRLFRMVITARHAPVSVLWRSLGYEAANLLPGHMGNMLLSPDDIERAQAAISRAYGGILPEALMETATRYCGWSVHDDGLRDVISFLPDGLARAREFRQGFLAIARAQI